LKILIAEDEEISRMVLEASLKKRGHDVVAVEDGLLAWKAFQKEYFPVMISDWMMPEIDGLALFRNIRNLPRDNYTYLVHSPRSKGRTRNDRNRRTRRHTGTECHLRRLGGQFASCQQLDQKRETRRPYKSYFKKG